MTDTLEMVRFRTVKGVTDAELLNAAEEVNGWLTRRRGFQYRTVVRDDEDWLDLIYWDSAQDAKAAAEAFVAAPETRAYMTLIDGKSVDMRHMPQHLQAMASRFEPA